MSDAEEFVAKRHKEYSANKGAWARFSLADYGGEAYAREALRKHPRETELEFAARKDRVMADDFAAKMVDTRLNYLFKEPAKLEDTIPSAVLKLTEDADAQGNSFDVLAQRAARVAEVYGTAVIVVDKPMITQPVRTQADALRLGDRPYMVVLPPTELLNFSERIDGTLAWALLRQPGGGETLEAETGMFHLAKTNAADYILWTPELIYFLGKKGAILNEEINPIGIVPIVAIRYKDVEGQFFGKSLLHTVESMNRELVNVDSMILQIMHGQTFSQLVIEGKPETKRATDSEGRSVQKEVVLGIQSILSYAPNTNPPQYISADASQVTALIGWRDKLIDAIHERADLTRGAARESGGQQASGISKAFDFLPTNQSLGNQARLLADGLENVLMLFGRWLGLSNENADYTITFPSDFGVQTTSELLTEIISLHSTMSLNVPREMTIRLLQTYMNLRYPEDSPEDKKKRNATIKSEIQYDFASRGLDLADSA